MTETNLWRTSPESGEPSPNERVPCNDFPAITPSYSRPVGDQTIVGDDVTHQLACSTCLGQRQDNAIRNATRCVAVCQDNATQIGELHSAYRGTPPMHVMLMPHPSSTAPASSLLGSRSSWSRRWTDLLSMTDFTVICDGLKPAESLRQRLRQNGTSPNRGLYRPGQQSP